MKNLFSVWVLFIISFLVKAQTSITIEGEILKNYGDQPFYLNASSDSPGAMSYTLINGISVSVTPDGEVTILKTGISTIKVVQEASPPFLAGTQQVAVIVEKAYPSTTIVSPGKVGIGGKVNLTAISNPPGATYTWSIKSQSGTSAYLNGSELTAGSLTGTLDVFAELVEDENFTAVASTSTHSSQIITVEDTSGVPEITFDDIYSSYGQYPFMLQSVSNSPGKITYAVIAGNSAAVSEDGYVEIIKTGKITILLSQEASPPYLSGTDTASLFIEKARPYSSIVSANTLYTGGKIKLEAVSYPQGAKYTWSIKSQNGTTAFIQEDTLISGASSGTLNIAAELVEDENFSAASATSTFTEQIVTIEDSAGVPKIVFNDTYASYGDNEFYLTSSSSSPGEITYSILNGSGAMIASDGLVTVTETGIVTIQLDQAASGPFKAVSKTANLYVNKANPRSTIISANKVGVGRHLELGVLSHPPGASYKWSISSQNGTNASLDGSDLFAGPSAGTLEISAELIEDENFSASAASSTHTYQTITVQNTSGVPTITFGNLIKNYGDQPFYLAANSDSPGKITYSITEGIAATVTPQGLVTIKEPGTVTIQADQEASAPYAAVTYNTLLTIKSIVTGLDENIHVKPDFAFPNPATDILYFNKGQQNCKAIYKITDIKCGTEYLYPESELENGNSIDLTGFNPGVYVVKASYCDREFIQKVIKQ